jgi:hypothetical protein
MCVAFSGLQRGLMGKKSNPRRSRPRSSCIITIIPIRCKENPLRPSRGGAYPIGPGLSGKTKALRPEGLPGQAGWSVPEDPSHC